jgi:hypothetical protein
MIMKLLDGTRVDEKREYHPGQFLPPIGSIIVIEPMNSTEGETEVYEVKGYIFTSEKSWNCTYDRKKPMVMYVSKASCEI